MTKIVTKIVTKTVTKTIRASPVYEMLCGDLVHTDPLQALLHLGRRGEWSRGLPTLDHHMSHVTCHVSHVA